MTSLRTILVVEDEPIVRENACEVLRDEGWTVLEAGDGEEALRIIGEMHAITALFTDIRLPGHVDGWQIAERFRERWPTAPVIYATGYSTSHTPVDGSLFFRKPYKLQQVVLCLETLTYAAMLRV